MGPTAPSKVRRIRSICWAAVVTLGAAALAYYHADRGRIPPFHGDVESAKPLPVTQAPSRFPTPFVARAYGIAQEIPEVLAQQPCYCHCERLGHRSLLDCYTTDHAVG